MISPVRCGLKIAEGACAAAILACRRPRRAFGAPLLIIGRSSLGPLICLSHRCRHRQSSTDDTNNDMLHAAIIVCMTCLLLPAEASHSASCTRLRASPSLVTRATGYWAAVCCSVMQLTVPGTLCPLLTLCCTQAWATHPGRMVQPGFRCTRDAAERITDCIKGTCAGPLVW